jgi:hypothetical protein
MRALGDRWFTDRVDAIQGAFEGGRSTSGREHGVHQVGVPGVRRGREAYGFSGAPHEDDEDGRCSAAARLTRAYLIEGSIAISGAM